MQRKKYCTWLQTNQTDDNQWIPVHCVQALFSFPVLPFLYSRKLLFFFPLRRYETFFLHCSLWTPIAFLIGMALSRTFYLLSFYTEYNLDNSSSFLHRICAGEWCLWLWAQIFDYTLCSECPAVPECCQISLKSHHRSPGFKSGNGECSIVFYQ